ncbi:hypothetical protein [Vibrio tapetis]|uniref:Uncharacterized protein n=1 Tax=Vibrio tapetis subsp. tapetis TaxID=1671868 RepID=A0A2N8Z9F4_9VIBR|nr:hypothetical protein [Vibrio tapetis]SON48517.1 protein of unknown function [Vibrio tapetis subsp. tapetis]
MEPIIYGVIGVVLAVVVWKGVGLIKRLNQRKSASEGQQQNQLLSGIHIEHSGLCTRSASNPGASNSRSNSPTTHRFGKRKATQLHLVASNAAASKGKVTSKATAAGVEVAVKKNGPPIKRKNSAEVIKLVYSRDDDVVQSAEK